MPNTAKVESGSQLLHRVMSEVTREFPSELGAARFPDDAEVFKRGYGDAMARFEAARVSSPQRIAIARSLTERTARAMTTSSVAEPRKNEDIEVMQGKGEPGLRVEIPFEGKLHSGAEARALIERLYADHHLTCAAKDGLLWTISHIDDDRAFNLRGQKFVILGAAAELSPAPLLLQAGASVLWVDLQRPSPPRCGTISYAAGASDLLSDPNAVLRAIRRFADGDRIHLGMFAYAPGKGRELRLAEAMNEIARELGKDALLSVTSFVSPTSPGELQPEDALVAEKRRVAPKPWQRALSMMGVLKGPGHYGDGSQGAARAVISLQGANYQAAQYVSKMLRAEVFAHDGFRVSANVAGISRTKSLQHPLFQAAFEGAPAFGVRIFEAETTRVLATLLMLHDILRPATALPSDLARARHVHAAQIHGGVYALPWQFEAAVRAAAVLGAALKPRVMWQRKSHPSKIKK